MSGSRRVRDRPLPVCVRVGLAPRALPRPSGPRAGALLVLLALLAPLALAPPVARAGAPAYDAPNDGGEAGARRVYLPLALSTGAGLRGCAAGAGGGCGASGWRPLCGGIGRVRDMQVEADRIVAVGDGAAEITLPTEGPIDDLRLQAQVLHRPRDFDDDLVSLNGLHMGALACPAGSPRCGWAVGDRLRIARNVSGCWRLQDEVLDEDGQARPARRDDPIALRSLVTYGIRDMGGWAVGEEDGRGVLFALRARSGQEDLWQRRPMVGAGSPTPPPMSDVDVVLQSPGFQAIGFTLGEGVLGRIEGPDDRWRPTDLARGGTPRELSMLDEREGWAFGRTVNGGPVSTTGAWLVQDGRQQLWSAVEGKGLVDAYKQRLDDGPIGGPRLSVWFGVVPEEGGSAQVLYQLEESEFLSRGPALGPLPGDAEGHRAIAPLPEGRVLYGWGDELWLYEPQLGWRRVSERLDLVDLAATPGGGWALAARRGAEGSRLLQFLAGPGLLLDPAPDAPDLPRLRAIASGHGETWAVGDGGLTWRARGSLEAWAPLHGTGALPGQRSHDLVVDAAGAPWVAGAGADGAGRLWRLEEGMWRERARSESGAALVSIAALPEGGVIAVGGPSLVVVPPGACPPDAPPAARCARELRPCYAGGGCLQDLRHVSGRGDGLWVAGRRDVIRHLPGAPLKEWAPWAWPPAPPGIPFEAEIAALVAESPEEALLAVRCCEATHEEGRTATHVLRHRVGEEGGWADEAGIQVPIRAATLGPDGRPWLAGDWSSLLVGPPAN